MTVTAVDLFCGVGGLSAGLMDAGLDVLEAYDNWPAATAVYNRNLGDGEHSIELDLANVDTTIERIKTVAPDLIAGAPPCQDFSTAGKRREGDRANLTSAFGAVVTACQPAAFLMENVPQVRLSATYLDMRADIERNGYRLFETTLDASLFGVPQKRQRFFVFGWLADDPVVGERFAKSIEAARSTQPLTVKRYLGSAIDIEHYYRHPRNYTRRSVWSVHEPSPTVRGVNRPVPPNYKGNHLDSVPPCTVRPLTTRERAQVQTFPIDWHWEGGDRHSDTELQIGNAVPVQLAARLGWAIREAFGA